MFSVIKFKVILIERLENHEATILGRVIRVFKHNNVTIHKGRVKIWSNTSTTCPSLGTGRVFLVCGHENGSTQKLLLSSTSLIEAWDEETLRKIRRWQRLEKKMGKKKQDKRWVYHWRDVLWRYIKQLCFLLLKATMGNPEEKGEGDGVFFFYFLGESVTLCAVYVPNWTIYLCISMADFHYWLVAS